jgi:tetratricopeptide (TPR) repeat protein
MPAQRLREQAPAQERNSVSGLEWRPWVCAGWLGAAAIVVYGGTIVVPFLLDDSAAIAGNQTIRQWGTAFWPPPGTTTSGRPLLNLSLAANYAVGGVSVWGYHALNIAIHWVAGLALFGIVRRTLMRSAHPAASEIAFFSALLWTLHPLQTESVTYVVQRAESLMGMFYLLTLYCFIRCVGANGRAQHLWMSASFTACLLGMASKEVMVSAPLIVLLYDRTFVAGSFRGAWLQHWRLHTALAATWLLLIVLVGSTGWNRNGMAGFDVGIAPWSYWLTQFEAVTRYLRLAVWPHPLVFEYGAFWVSRLSDVLPQALLVGGLALGAIVALWRGSALGFLGVWFFAILAPTSVMPGGTQMIVEHRMYLPLAALIVAGVVGLYASSKCSSFIMRRRAVPIALLLTLTFGYALLTVRRNEEYRSERTLWWDTVVKRPNNPLAHNCLGSAWSNTPGHLNDAVAEFREALRLRPDYAEAHYNLGNAWLKMPGRLNDAIAQYQEALRLQPESAEAHFGLGCCWEKMPERQNEAIAQFKEALRLKPDYAEAHNNFGYAIAKMPGRRNEAIAQFKEALRLKSDFAEAHYNLGNALSKIPGLLKDAIAQYQEALRLKPDFAEVHNNLGIAWSQLPGKSDEAIAQFEEALRLKPDLSAVWHNLGELRLQSRSIPEAVAAFQEELRLRPNDPEALKALDRALREKNAQKMEIVP